MNKKKQQQQYKITMWEFEYLPTYVYHVFVTHGAVAVAVAVIGLTRNPYSLLYWTT